MQITEQNFIEIIQRSGAIVDVEQLTTSSSLRDAGLDSMDMANILLEIEEAFGLKIPDADVPTLDSISSMLNYVEARITVQGE
jgi:acyl carrier protein